MPLRKIGGDDFFHLKADKAYYEQNVRIIEIRHINVNTIYLVGAKVDLPAAIRKEVKQANIYTGMTATKDLFLVYIKKSQSTWYESAIEMMRLALKGWVKIEADMNVGGCYNYYPPPHPIADPDWSDLPPFYEMLALALKGHIIESADHPAIRRKLGLDDGDSYGDDGAL
jgi:hypothetical protein